MIEEEFFHRALEKPTLAEQLAFLDEECANQPELRERVQRLLRSHRHEDSFLQTGVTTDEPFTEKLGTVIGPYKLLQQIGEGGMGTVYMAEQTGPIQRKVALKIIKTGMDSKQIIARFEAERQALAMMDHVNIARVFDAGTTGSNPKFESRNPNQSRTQDVASDFDIRDSDFRSGRPYFVMELVHGVPITKYCDDNHLTPRERLQLFVPVCNAIQHAHQKGIIHRDIKPSNVMVTLYDGKPVPKVIDFGVAKATEQKLTERTLFTQYGTMVGTLEYMSPEQAEMSALGVDTRSDIYSLGVLLYELLTGSTPLTHKRMKEAAYAEILRMIKEVEPPKPSTRLGDSGEALASISALRKTEPAKLTKLVKGELDWIVMKCLEKDRNRRYETANGFAMDVLRYLADEPVTAGPPSRTYRLRKFLRRNRGPVLAACLVLLALVGGIVGTSVGLYRAEQAREAEAEQRELAQGREQMAKQKEAEIEAVLNFVESKIIAAARPEGQELGLGHDVTLRRALEEALPFVSKSFTDQPLTEARLRFMLGNSFWLLGEAKVGAEQYERGRVLFAQHTGAESPGALACANGFGNCLDHLGRHEEAARLFEHVLRIRTEQLGPEHIDTLHTRLCVAASYAHVRLIDDARKIDEQLLPLFKTRVGADDPATLRCMANLANCYSDLGRHEESIQLQEEVIALRKNKLGHDHPDRLWSMMNLAVTYVKAGRDADALKLREEILPLMRGKLGAGHPQSLLVMKELALMYSTQARHADALALYEELVPLKKAKKDIDDPDTLDCMFHLANTYYSLERDEDALKWHEETLALRRKKLGDNHIDTLLSMNNVAACNRVLGRHAESLKLNQEALRRRRATLAPGHEHTLVSLKNVMDAHAALGQVAEALKMHEELLDAQKTALGADHENTLITMHNLANRYDAAGQHRPAAKLFEAVIPLMKKVHGVDHAHTLQAMHNLSNTYVALGRLKEAFELQLETAARRKVVLGADHPDALLTMMNVGNSYENFGQHEEARKVREETLRLQKESLGTDDPATLGSMYNLGRTYRALDRHADALKLNQANVDLCVAKFGPAHSYTLMAKVMVADNLFHLDRGAEVLPIIDDCLKRAGSASDPGAIDPTVIPDALNLRLRLFAKNKDAAGCRATAEMWEKLKRTDAASLYTAARMRSVTAAVLAVDDQAAAVEADRAMAWLRQAIDAGYCDAKHLSKDRDLDALRGRDDFKKLINELVR